MHNSEIGENAEENDTEGIRATKLRFKHRKRNTCGEKSKNLKPETAETDKADGEEVADGNYSDNKPDRERLLRDQRTKQRVKLTEYGRVINGYRFVATDQAEAFEEREATDELESSDRESTDARNGEEKQGWKSYEEYSRAWDSILHGEENDSIPLPVASNDLEDISRRSIRQFLDTDDRIKRERIRWHPDKMMTRLEKMGVDEETSPGYENVVTRVFQTINQVHDT